MIREGDIGEKLFPDFPDMKVDFSEIGIGKIGKIGLAPPNRLSYISNRTSAAGSQTSTLTLNEALTTEDQMFTCRITPEQQAHFDTEIPLKVFTVR